MECIFKHHLNINYIKRYITGHLTMNVISPLLSFDNDKYNLQLISECLDNLGCFLDAFIAPCAHL